MIRDPAAAVNAARTPQPVHIPRDHPPAVDPRHRWRCPSCDRAFRHPWLLVVHLAAPAVGGGDFPGHVRPELDAWTAVATVEPTLPAAVTPLARRPAALAATH